MWKWLRNRWYQRLRRIDMEVLWPACLAKTSDLDRAKAAFAWHALNDKAWLVLGHDRVIAFIDRLEK